MCQIKQFPLKLAWALTGHKVSGITIKRPNKLVVHGHPRMPPSMYYVMFSRAQDLEQVYKENLFKILKANEKSLLENENLVNRSIVPSHRDNHFCLFMVNIQSLENKIVDLTNDIHASKADHICVVETWLKRSKNKNFNLHGRLEYFHIQFQIIHEFNSHVVFPYYRTFKEASNGRGKSCGMFSLTSRKISHETVVVKE